jgi:hypothetical protein
MPRRVLRVFFYWGHPWPLWESGTDKYAMEPADYGYSPELVQLLRDWRRAWIPVADFGVGETQEPPTSEQYEQYETLSGQALARMREETAADIAIQDETD